MTKKSKSEKQWHLGETETELAFAELQHALICLSEAFYRYTGKSLSLITGDVNLTGHDSVIVHTINAMDRPKSITELQHFTNRSDVANIQYSVRKLVKAGLIKQVAKTSGRGTTYQITKKGRDVCNSYVESRKDLLAHFPQQGDELLSNVENATGIMVILTGLYDQASRLMTTRG